MGSLDTGRGAMEHGAGILPQTTDWRGQEVYFSPDNLWILSSLFAALSIHVSCNLQHFLVDYCQQELDTASQFALISGL